MASFKKSHVTAPFFPLAGLSPKPASGFENPPVLMGTHSFWTKNHHWDGGENGLGHHLEPPSPHSREFFFLPHSPWLLGIWVVLLMQIVPLDAVLLFDLHAAILVWLLAAVQPKKAASAAHFRY
jgi:hypothetical protein